MNKKILITIIGLNVMLILLGVIIGSYADLPYFPFADPSVTEPVGGVKKVDSLPPSIVIDYHRPISRTGLASGQNITPEYFTNSYKKLYVAMKQEEPKLTEIHQLASIFSKFSKAPNIEQVSKIKREWFERIAKGLSLLSTQHKNIELHDRKGDRDSLSKSKAMYKSIREKLIEVIKLRKTEYTAK